MSHERFSLFKKIALFYFCFQLSFAYAEDVLDFEAEVIEGEKKAPYLFIESDPESSDLSAIFYQRADFNDFHRADAPLRPRIPESVIQKPTMQKNENTQTLKK
ncbi:MAG: hypothetical protein ACO3A2_02720 [Bdellovibrionia bacterium]